MRSCLAALDLNANVSHAQASDSSGALRWKIKVDRAGKTFTTQARKQEKCEAWKMDIVALVRTGSGYVFVFILSLCIICNALHICTAYQITFVCVLLHFLRKPGKFGQGSQVL